MRIFPSVCLIMSNWRIFCNFLGGRTPTTKNDCSYAPEVSPCIYTLAVAFLDISYVKVQNSVAPRENLHVLPLPQTSDILSNLEGWSQVKFTNLFFLRIFAAFSNLITIFTEEEKESTKTKTEMLRRRVFSAPLSDYAINFCP